MARCNTCNDDFKLRMTNNGLRKNCACPDYSDYKPAVPATIIVPSKYVDVFEPCKISLDKYAPNNPKILVRDGQDIAEPTGPNWKTIQGPEGKFVYSRNINLGIQQSTGDVLLTNDDVLFTHPKTLEILQNVLDQNPDVGILSPKIDGMVGEYWQGHCETTLQYTECRLCFVCVLIRREVIEKIGLLEEFTGYGWDDCDFCRRTVQAGYKMAVTNKAVVKHGHIDGQWSTSYRREAATMDQMDAVSVREYRAKWGDDSLGNYK